MQWLLHWLYKLPLIDRTWTRKQLVFNVLLLLLLHPLQLLQLLRHTTTTLILTLTLTLTLSPALNGGFMHLFSCLTGKLNKLTGKLYISRRTRSEGYDPLLFYHGAIQ